MKAVSYSRVPIAKLPNKHFNWLYSPHFQMTSIPCESDPKLARLIVAFTRDLTDPIPFGSAIRTQTGSLLKMIVFGSDPKKVSYGVNGWDHIQAGMDRKRCEKIQKHC